MLLLPTLTDGTPFYSFRATIEGADYGFELQWSTREERWYLTLTDSQDNLLCSVKLLTHLPLLEYHHHKAVPVGELMVSTMSTDDSPPGFYDLGEGARCQLVYMTQAELEV